MRMAKLRSARIDPQYFPDIAQGRVLGAVHFPEFEMLFPVPEVQPLATQPAGQQTLTLGNT